MCARCKAPSKSLPRAASPSKTMATCTLTSLSSSGRAAFRRLTSLDATIERTLWTALVAWSRIFPTMLMSILSVQNGVMKKESCGRQSISSSSRRMLWLAKIPSTTQAICRKESLTQIRWYLILSVERTQWVTHKRSCKSRQAVSSKCSLLKKKMCQLLTRTVLIKQGQIATIALYQNNLTQEDLASITIRSICASEAWSQWKE